jgi:hypothetical protein
MEFIIGLYLVGYFISFGIAMESEKVTESKTKMYFTAIIFSSLSWINIGTMLGEAYIKYLDDDKNKSPN